MSGLPLMRRLIWLVIGLMVIACYWNGLEAPFIYDDRIEVVGNPTLRVIEDWRVIARYNLSRVLLILTYAWNYQRFGIEPFGYHLTSIAIHIGVVGAALMLGERLGQLARHPQPLATAALATAVWAVHPMLTESVTYITGRSESLCALWCFLGTSAWASALIRERDSKPGGGLRLLGVLAFLAAALTKEIAVVLPATLLAMEWLLGPRTPSASEEPPSTAARIWRQLRRVRWAWFIGFGLLVCAAALLRHQITGVWLPNEVERSSSEQLTTSAEVWLRYLRLWLLPVGQTIFHHVESISADSPRGIAAIAGWLALVAATLGLLRHRPLAGWAMLCAGLFLIPSTSFVSLKEHMAEHRSYQSGFFLIMGLAWLLPGRARGWGAGLAVAVLPVLCLLTVGRNTVWQSEIAIWEEATQRRPEVADAWYGLGDAHRFTGDQLAAQGAYLHATELDPGHLEAWNNLGIVRAEMGDHDGAEAAWLSALTHNPRYCKAHNNLASMAFRRQQWDVAISELQTSLSHCPDNLIAHYLLGNIFYEPRWNRELAIRHYEAVLEINPNYDRGPLIKERLLKLTW